MTKPESTKKKVDPQPAAADERAVEHQPVAMDVVRRDPQYSDAAQRIERGEAGVAARIGGRVGRRHHPVNAGSASGAGLRRTTERGQRRVPE